MGRWRWLGAGGLWLVAGISLGACGDDGPDVGDPESGARTIAEALCRLEQECCIPAHRPNGSYTECLEDRTRDMEDAIRFAEREGGAYAPECAEAVLAWLGATGCTSDGDVFAEWCEYGVCPLIFARGKAEGESCSGLECDRGLSCLEGVCVRTCKIPEGEACAVEGEPFGSCAATASCDGNSGLCEPIPGLGEACPEGVCQGDARCVEGTCEPPLGSGEPCNSPIDCVSGYCDVTCQSPPGLGEDCFMGVCDEGLVCHPNDRICIKAPGLGEPCDEFPDPECAEGLECVTGFCVYENSAWCQVSYD